MKKVSLRDYVINTITAEKSNKKASEIINKAGIYLPMYNRDKYEIIDGLLCITVYRLYRWFTTELIDISEIKFENSKEEEDNYYKQVITPAIVSGLRKIL